VTNSSAGNVITGINHATYSQPRVVRSYSKEHALFPAEELIFERFGRQFGGAVLDIAIGAGRTTAALATRSKRYIGIDYSQPMVAAARRLCPGADLRQLDMRDAPTAFAHEQFDAILISFNGIDYIRWRERTTLLASCRRLLSSEGVLAFSTHDLGQAGIERGFRVRPDLRLERDLLQRSPLQFAARLARLPMWLLRTWPMHLRRKRLEQTHAGYAYINDAGDNYGLLTLYVDTQLQLDTLKGCGFGEAECLAPWLTENPPPAFNYFVCRR